MTITPTARTAPYANRVNHLLAHGYRFVKDFAITQAQAEGLSTSAIHMRLKRGKYSVDRVTIKHGVVLIRIMDNVRMSEGADK